ncbi:MAG: HDOD domain-containing protein [Gammaproteobacteria bacterium]|nr:HDOD domain-containing protein [Gammaproteobacteria bacterium]
MNIRNADQTSAILPSYIGRFRISEQLGKGSQGVVYLARDPQLERHVAIKTVKLEKVTASTKQLLLKEAQTVARLQHPNIIPLYEAGEHLGKPFLVFEYVDGMSLADHIAREGKLNAKQAINIIAPVLNGIAYAHKKGVIHRDLNPHNILLTSGNNKPRIMDFGISTLLGQRTEKGIWGTLKYMSPEQCEEGKLTSASDTFSIGLILYELLTGHSPVEADNKFAVINNIVNGEIKIPEEVGPAMHSVLTKALQKEPEARYADALDMRQDLLNHLKQIAPDTTEASADNGESSNSTMQFLLRRMEHKKDFPTLSHQILEISQKARADGESSANALSNTILKDYSLSTKLLRLVNSPLYGQYGGKISTISRAVVILGFSEVRNAALGLMLLDHLKDKNQASTLKEACITSLMSGSIANGLSRKLKIKDSEEAYVCSMFHNMGKMLAIYYFPDEVEMILDHVKNKNMKEEHAAQSVLGVTFEEIGIAVGESWQLPHEIIESMHSLPPGELKKPISKIDLIKQMSGFSNEYCQLITSTPATEKNQAFEGIASRFSSTLSISRGQMEDIIGEAMDEMSKYAKLVNLDLKKSNLFNSAGKWSSKKSEELKEITDESAIQTSSQEASEQLARQENILNAIQEITEAILDGTPFNNILVMIMETIYSGFGFTRVMFCFINKSRTAIDARYGFGPDAEAIINRLSIPLGSDKDIFNKALKEHEDIIIEEVHSDENKGILPGWYLDKYAKKSLMVYPIIIKNIPIGILYIDNVTKISLANDNRLNTVKTLRNQIVLALKQSISS